MPKLKLAVWNHVTKFTSFFLNENLTVLLNPLRLFVINFDVYYVYLNKYFLKFINKMFSLFGLIGRHNVFTDAILQA